MSFAETRAAGFGESRHAAPFALRFAVRAISAVWLVLALGSVAQAQDSHPAADQSVDKQRASLDKQRAAVRAQVRNAQQDEDDFFTAPWSAPLAPLTPIAQDQPECEPVPQDQLEPFLEEIAKRDGMTPDLLRAVIEKESSYIPCAVSEHGAEGLMQLMPDTAAELGVSDPFDPEQNVDAGSRYLKQLIDRYGGNLAMALAAYNAGPLRVDGVHGVPKETRDYVNSFSQFLADSIAFPTSTVPPVRTTVPSPSDISMPTPK